MDNFTHFIGSCMLVALSAYGLGWACIIHQYNIDEATLISQLNSGTHDHDKYEIVGDVLKFHYNTDQFAEIPIVLDEKGLVIDIL